MTYDNLLIEADREGLTVKEKPLQSADGRIKGKRIAIREDIPTLCQKSCVLAEEIGHYYTAAGNIIDIQDVRNIKQEQKGRIWAYDKMIGLIGIIKAYERHCLNRNEMAEFLDVTEEFLQDALNYYKQKYGVFTVLDHYVIYFDPCLSIVEMY